MEIRHAWEREAASKYGIDRRKNREFFDMVWDDVGGSAEHEDFDACVETGWRYWSRSRERIANLANGTSSGGPPTVTVGGELRGVALDENAEAHISALSKYLARTAAVERRVMLFRRAVTGSVLDTFSREEAFEFLKSHSTGESEFAHPSHSLPWLDRHFHFSEGSVLERLSTVATYLEKYYSWTMPQAVYFTLCGGEPRAASLLVGYGYRWKGGVAHGHGRARIKIEAEPWIPSQYVRQAYCHARDLMEAELGGGSARSPGTRNMEIFGFVVDQSEIRIVSTEEGLARLEIPPWPKMMDAYNASLSNDDPRRYKEPKRFKRDYKRAQQAIIHTDYGLPGMPGQPMTSRETMERMRSIKARLSRDEARKVKFR